MVDESRADLEERSSRKNESSAIQLEAHERLTLFESESLTGKRFPECDLLSVEMKCSVQRLFGEQGRKRRADIGWIVDRRAASFPCTNVGDWCLRCTEPETIYLI